jgi:hypothetical protein
LSEAFSDLLNARMATRTTTAPDVATESAVFPLSGVQMSAASFADPPAALAGTEQLLDLMETYRRQLADESSSLSRISPTVRKMAEALPSLEAACRRLPADDDLRQTATRAMVTARLEIERFTGGAYNDG